MVSRLMPGLAALACSALLATILPGRSMGQAQSVLADPLTLEAALALAQRVHPDLRVAGANLAAARADSAFANVPAFNPELELQGTRGGKALGSGSESALGVAIRQQLELGGKRGARQSVATARSQVSAALWSAKAQEIASDVRARFQRALFLHERLTLVQELADLDRRVVVAAKSRVRDGSMTPLTGRLTELDLLRLEAQGRKARSDLRQALVALGLSIGQELPDSTRLSGEVRVDSLEAPTDSVVAWALRFRATGEVLRRQIAERRAALHLAERESKQNITLGVGLTREQRSISGDDFSGDPAIVGGIAGVRSTDYLWTASISTPLPLRQRNQAARARAAAEIVSGQSEYERYRLQTRLDVLGAVRRFEDAVGLYRLYLDRSARNRQDLVMIREAYADGRISLDSYLTQKGRLVDTLLGQIEAGDTYWDARGRLEAITGVDLEQLNAGGAR